MNESNIPEMINNFNVYKNGNKFIGISGELILAELANMTETISGSGLLGEIDVTAIGHFSSMKQEIPFRILDDDIFEMANPLEVQEITLRASEQSTVKSTGNTQIKGMRLVYRGKVTSFNPGTLKLGGQMGASITMEVHAVLIEIDGKVKLELDKLNNVYKVNGQDILQEIKSLT